MREGRSKEKEKKRRSNNKNSGNKGRGKASREKEWKNCIRYLKLKSLGKRKKGEVKVTFWIENDNVRTDVGRKLMKWRLGYDRGVQAKLWKAKEKNKHPMQIDNRNNVKNVFCQKLFFPSIFFFNLSLSLFFCILHLYFRDRESTGIKCQNNCRKSIKGATKPPSWDVAVTPSKWQFISLLSLFWEGRNRGEALRSRKRGKTKDGQCGSNGTFYGLVLLL